MPGVIRVPSVQRLVPRPLGSFRTKNQRLWAAVETAKVKGAAPTKRPPTASKSAPAFLAAFEHRLARRFEDVEVDDGELGVDEVTTEVPARQLDGLRQAQQHAGGGHDNLAETTAVVVQGDGLLQAAALAKG